jgi:multidrug efflux pump subunit AcrB
MIALAGVMRNSGLLMDFIEISLNDGEPLKQAIMKRAVRTSPILLTTGAGSCGASIILFDPLFQGFAIC